jgi:hypothetical protein
MVLDIQNFILLFYVLPGFLVYAIVYRLLNIESKKDTFSTTLISLFLSLIIFSILSFLGTKNVININIIEWRLTLATILVIFVLIITAIMFLKWVLPWLENKIQIFDSIKYSTLDVFSDVLADRIRRVGKSPIWVCVCTKDNLIYSGYVKRQGLLTDNKKAIYIKDVLLLNSKAKDYRIDEFEGILFVEENIKWVSLVKNNSDNQ